MGSTCRRSLRSRARYASPASTTVRARTSPAPVPSRGPAPRPKSRAGAARGAAPPRGGPPRPPPPFACARPQPRVAAGLEVRDGRALEDLAAKALDGPGEPAREPGRVDGRAVRAEERALGARDPDAPGRLFLVEQLQAPAPPAGPAGVRGGRLAR